MSDKNNKPVPGLIKWLDDVAEHDYAAAQNYLSIRGHVSWVKDKIDTLREEKVTLRRANDILRATHLSPLPLTDPGVLRDLKKLLADEKLSPVLLVDGDIADGYHRVSLAYALDPFAMVPLKIA